MSTIIPFAYNKSLTMDPFFRDVFDEDWRITNFEKRPKMADLALDVKETDTHYELLMDAPGIDKEKTKIEIHDHLLTVAVEKKQVDVKETEKMKSVERFAGKSMRSLRLGKDVDEDKVEASYVDGVLHVKLAKKSPEVNEKKVKTIPIH